MAVMSLLMVTMSLPLTLPPIVAHAQGTSLSVNPSSGPRGAPVTATGDGFPANDTGIQIWFDQEDTGARANADSNGHFSVEFRVPSDATPGLHPVYATDGRNSASASFTVTSGPVPWDCNHLVVPAGAFYDGQNFTPPEICFEGAGSVNLADYGWAKRAESINVGVHSGCFYDGANETGNSWCFSGSFTKSDLGSWNNRIVSFQIS